MTESLIKKVSEILDTNISTKSERRKTLAEITELIQKSNLHTSRSRKTRNPNALEKDENAPKRPLNSFQLFMQREWKKVDKRYVKEHKDVEMTTDKEGRTRPKYASAGDRLKFFRSSAIT